MNRMFRTTMLAGLCALSLAACTAQEQRVGGGALLGGAAGALIGGAATGRAGGALAGGVIGAAAGGLIGGATAPAPAYGYYERPPMRYRCSVYDPYRGYHVRQWCYE